MEKKRRPQPRVADLTRLAVGSALLPAIERCVQADMRRFEATRSFVIATVLVDHYEKVLKQKFTDQARCHEPVERARLRRRA